jgi:hypothetical protein
MGMCDLTSCAPSMSIFLAASSFPSSCVLAAILPPVLREATRIVSLQTRLLIEVVSTHSICASPHTELVLKSGRARVGEFGDYVLVVLLLMLRGRGNGVKQRERGLLFRGMAIQRIGEIIVWSSVFKSPDFGLLKVYVS